ncbi:MAG: hypothetical protein ACK4QW_14885 [Alphaproteobacteria bacterium]
MHSAHSLSAPGPAEGALPIACLSGAEQLVVWVFRCRAFAHQAGRSIERDLVRRCGREAGEAAAVAIWSILALIALYGRRSLRLAPPGWPAVTADELRLLQLFAATQCGRSDAAHAHLVWIFRPGHADLPVRALAHSAAALARHGLSLPWRGPTASAAAALHVRQRCRIEACD